MTCHTRTVSARLKGYVKGYISHPSETGATLGIRLRTPTWFQASAAAIE
jgi:hypothetical protein